MKLRKIFMLNLLSATLLSAMDASLMPPMVPTLGSANNATAPAVQAKPTLGSCDIIPPMIINLPPPLEDAVAKCKNERDMPKKEFVQEQLSKLFGKKTEVKTIESVEKFNQLYRVTYDGGVILCNKSVDAFIKQ